MKLVFDAAISEINISASNMEMYNPQQVLNKIALEPNHSLDIADIARKMFESNKLYKVTIEEAKGE